jgi:hypothetical protein
MFKHEECSLSDKYVLKPTNLNLCLKFGKTDIPGGGAERPGALYIFFAGIEMQ